MLPSRDDRDKMKIQAEVYAMLTTVDCLEDMFASGYVEKSDVRRFSSIAPRCRRILAQFPHPCGLHLLGFFTTPEWLQILCGLWRCGLVYRAVRANLWVNDPAVCAQGNPLASNVRSNLEATRGSTRVSDESALWELFGSITVPDQARLDAGVRFSSTAARLQHSGATRSATTN
jgi:hypothetical protein